MHVPHFRLQSITIQRALESILGGLFALSLVLFVAGCGGAGANGGGGGDGDGNGDGDGGGGDTTAPAAPSGLKGESLDSAINLTWSAVDASDLDGYNVYRSTSSIGDLSGLSPQNQSLLSDTTGYRDESVENGTTYHYVVTAVDTADNASDPSNEVEKTPFDDPPDRPGN